MPGTDRLHSGVRTTYAVVVVPEEATALVLESNGCYFPRSSYQPNNFADTLGGDWNAANRTSRNCSVRRPEPLSCRSRRPASTAETNSGLTVFNFRMWQKESALWCRFQARISRRKSAPSSTAFRSFTLSVGPTPHPGRQRDGRATADDLKGAEIAGFLERIDANKVLLSFKMPSDFQGTPTITLIAPGRATDINFLPHVRVNDVLDTSLGAHPIKMFGHGPGPDAFRIDKMRVFRSQRRKDSRPRSLVRVSVTAQPQFLKFL